MLVVDDDAAIADMLVDVLRFEGYEVEHAPNGAEALLAVERGVPALVLLDMRMPILDGWGFAAAIRERGIDVPVVVMTAARDARSWAEEVGASGYLAKPFDLPELLSMIEQLRRRVA